MKLVRTSQRRQSAAGECTASLPGAIDRRKIYQACVGDAFCVKYVWSYLYDPGLYDEMCVTHEAMMSAVTWDEMLEKSKDLTDMYQRDYGALPGVQKPVFVAFSSRLKGVVLVTEQRILLWHYLYL